MALTVAKIRGIPVRLHWTFLLALPLFAWFMARVYFAEDPRALVPPVADLAWGAGLAVFLFLSVLAHEFGHSLVAKGAGLDVRGITLLPIGGVSEIPERAAPPAKEFRYTAAGPAVNFVVGLPLLGLAWALAGGRLFAVEAMPDWLAFLAWAGALNVFIGAFNAFLPAFPMDGGRLLRSLLATRMGHERATVVAANVGRVLAGLMVVGGFLIGSVLLMAVGAFVWIGARQEAAMARRRARTRERPA